MKFSIKWNENDVKILLWKLYRKNFILAAKIQSVLQQSFQQDYVSWKQRGFEYEYT